MAVKSKSKPKSKTNRVANKVLEGNTIQKGFHGLVWGEEPIFHAKELSDILGFKNPRSIYKLLRGEQKITPEQFVITARESALRGDYSLLELCMPDGHIIGQTEEGETDGSLDNEIIETIECLGVGRKLFNAGKYRQSRPYIDAAKKEIATMDKELREKGL